VDSNNFVRPTVAGAAPELAEKQLMLRMSMQINGSSLICEESQNDTFGFPLSNKTMDGFICVAINTAPDFPFHPWLSQISK